MAIKERIDFMTWTGAKENMPQFQPPPFEPHRVIRGGHLQTILSIRAEYATGLDPVRHVVPVSDGDAIMLHEDRPANWRSGDPSILLWNLLDNHLTRSYDQALTALEKLPAMEGNEGMNEYFKWPENW